MIKTTEMYVDEIFAAHDTDFERIVGEPQFTSETLMAVLKDSRVKEPYNKGFDWMMRTFVHSPKLTMQAAEKILDLCDFGTLYHLDACISNDIVEHESRVSQFFVRALVEYGFKIGKNYSHALRIVQDSEYLKGLCKNEELLMSLPEEHAEDVLRYVASNTYVDEAFRNELFDSGKVKPDRLFNYTPHMVRNIYMKVMLNNKALRWDPQTRWLKNKGENRLLCRLFRQGSFEPDVAEDFEWRIKKYKITDSMDSEARNAINNLKTTFNNWILGRKKYDF